MQMVDTSECNMPKSDADRANVIATRYQSRNWHPQQDLSCRALWRRARRRKQALNAPLRSNGAASRSPLRVPPFPVDQRVPRQRRSRAHLHLLGAVPLRRRHLLSAPRAGPPRPTVSPSSRARRWPRPWWHRSRVPSPTPAPPRSTYSRSSRRSAGRFQDHSARGCE
jgi:hypothetical protein